MTSEELRQHDEGLARRIYIGGKPGDVDRDLIPAQIFNIDGGVIMAR